MEAPPPVSMAEKQSQLESRLAALKNPQDRLAWLARVARERPPLEDRWKTDAHRVEGCLAKTWFVAEFAEGRCRFRADSESAITRGVALLLCDFYSGQTPPEILAAPVSFLEKYGVHQHLTPNRRNSLSKLFIEIERFARANL